MTQRRGHQRKRIVQDARNLRESFLLEPSEHRVKGHCKKETTHRTTLSYSSGHTELAPFCSRKFHVRGAVPIKPSQETTEEIGQPSVLEHREDPRVIDTGISSSKVSQENTWFLRNTRDMGQSSGLNLKDVVCHLPRRDASLRAVNALHGVPVKVSTYGRGKKLAITIAQCQRAERFWRSNDKTLRDRAPFQNSTVSIKEELRTQTTSTPADTARIPSGPGAESF